MIVLSDKKVDHLTHWIEEFYDTENDVEKMDAANTIIGVINFLIETENVSSISALNSVNDFMNKEFQFVKEETE